VAHEVNTPLAVISNYIQMLAKQMPDGDPRHSIIEKIVKQTFRASEIVNNLLNFSRTGRRRTCRRGPESLGRRNTLAGRASPEDFADSRGQAAHRWPSAGARFPPTSWQQVFLNLFLNARDAMPTGGMLEVRTSAHNGSVRD